MDHFEQFQHISTPLPLSARATPVAAPATAPATAPASAVRGRSSGMAPTSMNGMLRRLRNVGLPESINFLGANQFHKSQWMSMDSEWLNQFKWLWRAICAVAALSECFCIFFRLPLAEGWGTDAAVEYTSVQQWQKPNRHQKSVESDAGWGRRSTVVALQKPAFIPVSFGTAIPSLTCSDFCSATSGLDAPDPRVLSLEPSDPASLDNLVPQIPCALLHRFHRNGLRSVQNLEVLWRWTKSN